MPRRRCSPSGQWSRHIVRCGLSPFECFYDVQSFAFYSGSFRTLLHFTYLILSSLKRTLTGSRMCCPRWHSQSGPRRPAGDCHTMTRLRWQWGGEGGGASLRPAGFGRDTRSCCLRGHRVGTGTYLGVLNSSSLEPAVAWTCLRAQGCCAGCWKSQCCSAESRPELQVQQRKGAARPCRTRPVPQVRGVGWSSPAETSGDSSRTEAEKPQR
jgi:hypothetical protein